MGSARVRASMSVLSRGRSCHIMCLVVLHVLFIDILSQWQAQSLQAQHQEKQISAAIAVHEVEESQLQSVVCVQSSDSEAPIQTLDPNASAATTSITSKSTTEPESSCNRSS